MKFTKYLLSFILFLLCLTAGAETEFTYTYEGATLRYCYHYYTGANAALVGWEKLSDNVIIPKTVSYKAFNSSNTKYYNIIRIETGAFKGCTDMTSLTLPEDIYICSEAFKGCTNLTSVKNFNETNIGQQAFMDCSSLTSVDLSSAESIEQQAFCNCSSLISVILSYKFTAINDGVFSGCKKLRSITIPNSVSSIGTGAFQDCSSLTSIDIPNSVSSIGGQAFNGCTGLMVINASGGIPPKVNGDCFDAITYQNATLYVPAKSIEAYINTYPWSKFRNIQSTNIQEFKFSYDYSNETATVIGYDKEKLSHNPVIPKKIKVQNKIYTVSTIGEGAFSGCTTLTSVDIPYSITDIRGSAFSGCTGLTSVYIPNGIKSINDYAFYGCSSLTSVDIPNSVTGISSSAFSGCTGLTSVNIHDVAAWCNIKFNNADENPLSTAHNLYLNGKKVENLVIPKGVKSINDYAFHSCSSLTSVDIPNSVTGISSSAFSGCTGLISVNIHDVAAWCNIKFNNANENPLSIAHNLYLNGEKVTNLVIPEGVMSINNYAFYGCSNLTSVDIPNSVTNISSSAFYGCTGLTSVNIHDVAAWCNIKFNNANENPLSITHNLHLNGEKVGNLVIPEGVKSINDYAFNSCSSLISVDIPNSVTAISKSAFEGCSSLVKVNINDIAAWCNIKFERAEANPLRYAGGLYLNGEKITNLIIPEGVTTINNYAFNNYTGLSSVSIPNTVTTIGDEAFRGCTGLTTIYSSNPTPPSVGALCFYKGNANTTVYVPHESVIKYKRAEGWKDLNIQSDATGLIYSYDTDKRTATVTGINKEYKSPYITIPATTTYQNKSYKVVAIGERAFQNQTGLKTVTISKHITFVGNDAFDGCSGLNSVIIQDIAAWCNIRFGNYKANPLYYGHDLYLNKEKITNLVIPNDVTSIGNFAFYGCTCFTLLTIPNSVTSIGEQAFIDCQGLTSIYSSSLIPPSIQNYCFNNYHHQDVTLYVPQQSVQEYKTANDWKDFVKIKVLNDLGLEFSYDTYNRTATVTGFDKNRLPSNLTIPATTEYLDQEYRVTGIGNDAFTDCGELISIDIPNSVGSIGSNAFKGCTGLTTVNINDIAAWCNIEFGNINANPLSITHNIYMNGEKVTDIVIPDNVKTINSKAFYGCSGLNSVTISKGVTTIGSYAFYGCTGLTSVDIPNSIRTVNYNAFSSCTGLKEVNIHDVAAWCGITFSEGLTNPLYYSHNLYLNGEKVTDLVIPDNVKAINSTAFYGCSGLNSVTIPKGVTTIGTDAFNECTGLTMVNINDVAAWCSIEFGNASANPLYYGHNLYLNGEQITNLVIPDGVKSISNKVFYGCSGLNSVTIPKGVTTIGTDAFSGCTGLTMVNINDVAAWCNINFGNIGANPLYYGHNLYLNGEKVTNLVIPDGVKSISNKAFYGCSGLNSAKIPDGILVIKEDVFRDCSGLTSISIPNSVRVIEQYAFYGCNSLAAIYSFNLTPPDVADYNFDDSNYQNATLYVPDDAVEDYKTTLIWRNFQNIQGFDPTGIKGIEADENNKQDVYYDISGRKLNAPVKGLNIINGKKVIIK